jgi:hypothetical protein
MPPFGGVRAMPCPLDVDEGQSLGDDAGLKLLFPLTPSKIRERGDSTDRESGACGVAVIDESASLWACSPISL